VNKVVARLSDGHVVKRMAAGLFLEPADPDPNNEHCDVISAAAREIGYL
jgi:hypothetical protein